MSKSMTQPTVIPEQRADLSEPPLTDHELTDVMGLALDELASRGGILRCPGWCDPTRHMVDVDDDGVISVTHVSRKVTIEGGWTMPEIVRVDRGLTVESLVISTDPLETTEGTFDSRQEAHTFLTEFINAFTDVMLQAWPSPGDNPRSPTADEMADFAANLRRMAKKATTKAKQLSKV